MASTRTRLSFSVLLVAGLGAMAFLSGCEVTVREPGVVVTPPVVAVETPGVVVEAPAVVLEEGVGVGGVAFVAAPVGVEYVLIGGRYAYFHPGFNRWYYRPVSWRPPVGYRAREVHGVGELESIHRSEVRRNEPGRPGERRAEPRREQKKEAPKKEQKREEPKKKEKEER